MKKLYILIYLISLAGFQKLQAQTFTTVSGDPLTNLTTTSYGQAWGDFNNDGWIDVYVANLSDNNLLFTNDGTGNFLDGIIMPTASFGSQSYGGSWGDYDNDGDLDLYGAERGGMNRLYINDGTGNFTYPSYPPITTDFGISVSTSCIDFNNDGLLDLSVANFGSSQVNNLYRNDGGNTFTNVYPGTGGFDQSLAWSDYDNDGFMELFIARNNNTSNLLFDNDGTGLTQVTGSATTADVSSSYSASWADYDNDGDFDLFVTNSGTDATSVNQLYRNDGGGNFTKITTGDIVNDIGNSRGSDWGDYDNDGWIDLYVTNRNQNFLYRNNGDGTFTRITSGDIVNLLSNSYSCSWNDINNDGFLDLYVITDHSSTGNALFLNNTNENHYLNVRLVGTASNASAIGAKVRVKANINGTSFWQIREV
ncbi:MAG: FG-GAP repeat domain-containing protein, partial [Cyclobacteriaceae bacterium]